MREKVDKLVEILSSGHFSMEEIAKIAIAMELNATVNALEETLDLDPNMRYRLAQVYRNELNELNKLK